MSGASPTDFVYDSARAAGSGAGLNWATSNVQAMLVSAAYIPSLSDQYVSAIPAGAIITRDAALTSLAEPRGICAGLIPQWNALSSALTAVAIVLYINSGTDSSSPLVYYSSSGPGFPFQPTGFNYYCTYNQTAGGWFQL